MRVAFLGTPDFAVPSLRKVHEAGHEVVAVICQPDRPAGRGMKLRPCPVKELALELGLAVHQPERCRGRAFRDWFATLDVEVGLVVAYGQILPAKLLAVPPRGFVNVHPSLLPLERGAAPLNWTIIRGRDPGGITIYQLDAGMDSGPIFLQEEEALRPGETASSLHDRFAERGGDLLCRWLELAATDRLPEPRAQDHGAATHAPKLDRDLARIDWRLSAREIDRWVRGLFSHPCAQTRLGDRVVKVLAGEVLGEPAEAEGGGASGRGLSGPVLPSDEPGTILSASGEGLVVACGRGAYRIDRLQVSGKRPMTAGDFCNGYRPAVGDRFALPLLQDGKPAPGADPTGGV